MKHLVAILWFCAGLLDAGLLSAQGREEFNGPYASWANLRTRFGAKGNGKDDDTRALQNALDHLANPVMNTDMGKDAYTVLYLPAGTYCISSTLTLRGKIGVAIIGEDPAKTIIKWTGVANDTVLWTNGSAYFKISRLTFDANKRVGMEGIGIHWKDRWNNIDSKSFAPLNIELSDNIFTGGFKLGISGGTYGGYGSTGANDSEIAIRRCIFRECGYSAIEIAGFNALDYWIWDCVFQNCGTGVHASNGNFHVYRSMFTGSISSDVNNNNAYYTSVRGCYSENSNALSLDAGMSSNPFKRIFQDNTIVGPKVLPVEFYHLGKISLMGNKFGHTVDTAAQFSINTKSWAPGNYEVLSLHNTYAYKQPIRIASSPQRLYSVGDAFSPDTRSSAAAFAKSMDQQPATVSRKIFEVPANSDASAIQAILNQAAALKGQRPVVHFGVGSWYIDRTLVIPAGSDMQLAGDGLIYASVITEKKGTSLSQKPILLVKGPSYITIKDLTLGDEAVRDRGKGIVFQNVDQPSSQVHLDQIYSSADTSLYVDGLNYLYVQKDNSFFTDGNYVSGGQLVQQKKGTARVACFGGQFAFLTVKNNASFCAKDCWWEGSARVPLRLQGDGNVTIDGSMIAPNNVDSNTTVDIGRFNGNVCLMNMYLQGALSVFPNNPGLQLLVWNINFYHKMAPLAFLRYGGSYKGAFLGINMQCFRKDDPACKDILTADDRVLNVPDTNGFLDAVTAQDRTNSPVPYRNLAAGVSNIYISRVSLGGMKRGLSFIAN